MASTFLLAATRRHLQSRRGEERGIKVNLHTPRCIGCLVWRTCFQIVQVLQSRGWLRSVHDNIGVEMGWSSLMFHARGDALLDSASQQQDKTSRGAMYGPVRKILARRDVMSDFILRPYLGWRLQDKLRDLLHRSPHAFNPRVEMSTRCQMCRPVAR